jgi:ribosome-associated toxin RatA of RatAB toxin-antitoxin module
VKKNFLVMAFVAIIISLMFSTQALAKPRKIELAPLPDKLDVVAMAPMLTQGELIWVNSQEDGKLKQASIMSIVNAPVKKTWDAVTDYDHYNEFMPRAKKIIVLSREGGDAVLSYTIDLPGPDFVYTLRHHHTPMTRVDIWPENDKGDIKTGAWRWELFPYSENKTILVYTFYTDIRESSWILKIALKSDPSMEHGINIATGLVTVNAIKRWAEKQENIK